MLKRLKRLFRRQPPKAKNYRVVVEIESTSNIEYLEAQIRALKVVPGKILGVAAVKRPKGGWKND